MLCRLPARGATGSWLTPPSPSGDRGSKTDRVRVAIVTPFVVLVITAPEVPHPSRHSAGRAVTHAGAFMVFAGRAPACMTVPRAETRLARAFAGLVWRGDAGSGVGTKKRRARPRVAPGPGASRGCPGMSVDLFTD